MTPDHDDPFLAELSADVGTHEMRLNNHDDEIRSLQMEVQRLTDLIEHGDQ